ncbi:MAG: arginine N-succinyltransferase [Caulobacteraceae bacterium]
MTATPVRLKIRPARASDVDGLYELALTAGVGMTNLPPDRDALAERVGNSLKEIDAPNPGAACPMMLVLEADGRIAGTGMVVSRVGSEWPFYTYKVNRLSQRSRDLNRTVTCKVLNLVNDFEGYAEVGGLFLDKTLRGVKAGRLISRSRYLFIAQNRRWFGDCICAELRGMQDDKGRSPFWEAVGKHFYQMEFDEADRENSLHGNQFIADLGPKHPIYVNLLPKAAQEVMGEPHQDGRQAYELLLEEGFRDEDYIDIFDGGPTVYADIDELKAVGGSRVSTVMRIGGETLSAGVDSLVCTGHGHDFRCSRGEVNAVGDDVIVTSGLAQTLDLKEGDAIRHVEF